MSYLQSSFAVSSVVRIHPPLVLASASARRRDLLANVGIGVVVRPVAVDEAVLAGEAPDVYLERVTRAKLLAAVAAGLGRDRAILVADTIVVARGEVLGKPIDEADAARMIGALSGAWHEVSTRFAIALAGGAAAAREATVTTRVLVRTLDAAWIARYVATGEGRDKAGAYAIQGIFSAAIARIEGSYTNVVGLPISEVVEALEALGLLGDFPRGDG